MNKFYYSFLAVFLMITQLVTAQSYQFTKVADLQYAMGVVFNSNNEMYYYSQADNLYDETGTNLLGSTGIENICIGVENETIWTGGYSGATEYNSGSGATISYNSFAGVSDAVYDIDYFQNNTYVALETSGLAYYNGTDWNLYTTADGMTLSAFTCVTHDNNGTIYVGGLDASWTQGNVDYFDGNDWNTYAYAEHGVGNIWNIFIDSNDNLWVVGSSTSMWDGTTWTQFGNVAGTNIYSIEQDLHGNIWFGGMGQGLYVYDGNTFELVTSAPINPSGRTNGITIDNNGELFVALSDGSGADGIYKVEVLDGNSIVSYSFTQQTEPAVINQNNYTVNIEVANGTDLTNLLADFTVSVGATATVSGTLQESGVTSNNFTSPVTYVVESGTGTTQNWTVTVTEEPLLNNENEIITFSIPDQTFGAIINNTSHTVEVNVPNGTNLSNIIASFTISDVAEAYIGATMQESGVTGNDFTNTVIYSIHAENGSIQDWYISVNEEGVQNNENDILTYSFSEQTGVATINNTNHTVEIEVANGSNIGSLIASFSLSSQAEVSVGGTLQESSVTSNDFTSPVTYTIEAGNGDMQDWTITVTEDPLGIYKILENNVSVFPNPTNGIVNFRFNDNSIRKITISDITGKQIIEKTEIKQNEQINLSHSESGIYIISIQTDNEIYNTKIVKR